MGFFKLSAVFLLALLQWKVHGDDIQPLNCPPNSKYDVIGMCDTNCSNIGKPLKGPCFDIGILSCKCDEGLLPQTGTHDENVQCVKPEDCKVPCGPNQHYKFCGSSCPATCKEPKGPENCLAVCSPRCVCNEGYVLSGKTCVKPTEC
ncbi:serine protease inhibitor swm-1-like isoform X2 [Bufo gargarizans]|uniref:serine protease inhibitor swm-1-like isoform X1 n=1 Tax=Bufo gargarizans TaxID=30331 RepID=UPI001CF5D87C|nr:serine protease inhibitor swm-1-like isoform X1 [Bufo gargarizans]XP_044138276.1 serine protease inhibitor swm-1-like isoform X2 [Bufo gargarizans]